MPSRTYKTAEPSQDKRHRKNCQTAQEPNEYDKRAGHGDGSRYELLQQPASTLHIHLINDILADTDCADRVLAALQKRTGVGGKPATQPIDEPIGYPGQQ